MIIVVVNLLQGCQLLVSYSALSELLRFPNMGEAQGSGGGDLGGSGGGDPRGSGVDLSGSEA